VALVGVGLRALATGSTSTLAAKSSSRLAPRVFDDPSPVLSSPPFYLTPHLS